MTDEQYIDIAIEISKNDFTVENELVGAKLNIIV